MRRYLGGLLILVGAAARADEPVDYLREIKPVLQEKCLACHGALKQNARLRLDTGALMVKGGKGGPAVRPGDADGSPLIQRVTAADTTERMPPEGPPLSAASIAKLRAWIKQGAPAPSDEQPEREPRDHWAFRAPIRPAVPMPRDLSWSENPIDAFVVAGHAKQGLTARAPAERALLLRRVYLDLIGLPPTPEELRAFQDDPAPDAYDRVVRRLLDSPAHGERWARHWMDVWRYSDWYGRRMVPDVWNSAPQIWRWRDWIVRSLNEDRGYDRMVREMLAGDEVAAEDDEAGHATGYLIRNWYALNPNDWMRANVEHSAKAFLGLTFNCAHCHDHKYDPISHEDYFRFRAFFEPLGIRQDRVPGEADPGPFQEYNYSTLRKVVRLGSVRVFDKNPKAPTWFYTGGDERNRVKEKGPLEPGVPAFLGKAEVRPVDLPAVASQPALRPALRQTLLTEKEMAMREAEARLEKARKLYAAGLPQQRQRFSLAVAELAGAAVVPGAAYSHRWYDNLRHVGTNGRLCEDPPLEVRAAETRLAACRAELESTRRRLAADMVRMGMVPAKDAGALGEVACRAEREAKLASAEAAALEAEWNAVIAETTPGDGPKEKASLLAARKTLTDARAALTKVRAEAQPKTYSPVGPAYPRESTGRRRALAEWITSRDNPLAARVAVNHVWTRHFHAPLVASVFDFGRNGATPSHPELLDWLAVEFMESGWSMKHLHRLIVTSRTYRMASSAGPDTTNAKSDPENRYLWRMNTGRMEAEVVRDSLLACAGELDRTMGGQEIENSEALKTHRRSLYYSCYPENGGRNELGALFDAPDAGECYRRTRTVMPQQALALTNSDLIHGVSQKVLRRVEEAGPESSDAFVVAAYETVLARRPTAAELDLCRQFLDARAAAGAARARESLVRVLFNHNDFVAIR